MRAKCIFAAALVVMTAISSLTVNVKATEHRNTVYISTKASFRRYDRICSGYVF